MLYEEIAALRRSSLIRLIGFNKPFNWDQINNPFSYTRDMRESIDSTAHPRGNRAFVNLIIFISKT